jgi:hypothetical protein
LLVPIVFGKTRAEASAIEHRQTSMQAILSGKRTQRTIIE